MRSDPMQQEVDDYFASVLYAQDPILFLTHWFSLTFLSGLYLAQPPQRNIFALWFISYSIANCAAVGLWVWHRYWPRLLGARKWIRLHALRNIVLYSAPGLSICFAFYGGQANLPILHTLLLVFLAAVVFMSNGFDLFNFASAISLLILPAMVVDLTSHTHENVVIGIVLAIFFIAMNVYAVRYRKLFRNVVQARVDQQHIAETIGVQKRVAEEASLAKTRFFAAASHDLRQPLHAIGLLAESLKDDSASLAQRDATANSIISNVESLNRLFNQVLDLARIESGVTQVIALHFRLAELFTRIETQYRPAAAAKGLALRIAPTSVIAHTDPVLLERVLSNLVSNAVRYTDHGAIWIGLRRTANTERRYIEVRDSGIGIAAHEHELVFEEFYQVPLAQLAVRQGHGLGLSTVKRLLSLLGDELTMRSAPGRGTTMRVPVKLGDESLITASLGDPASVGASVVGRRILCIDDEPAILEALDSLLSRWGCVVRGFRDEHAAIRAIAGGFIPDALLCDYQTGKHRTGGHAVRAVSEALRERGHGGVVTLLITGDMASPELATLAAQGIPVLHKPVTPTRLRRTLDALWQQAEQHASLERVPPVA